MGLEALYFVPHGMQIIPGLENPYTESFRPLHQAMESLKADVSSHSIDLYFLITPHGMGLENRFGIVKNAALRGHIPYLTRSNVDGDRIFQTIECPGNPEYAQKLNDLEVNAGVPCELQQFASQSYPFPLAWGETVPLYYLQSSTAHKIPTVIISLPRSRQKMAQFHKTAQIFGHTLGKLCANSDLRIGIILSGDLSHVHQSSGPYGFHPAGKQCDQLITQWFLSGKDDILIKKILPLADEALVCGLSNLFILQQLKNQIRASDPNQWNPHVLAYEAPTYFGMSVAKFL